LEVLQQECVEGDSVFTMLLMQYTKKATRIIKSMWHYYANHVQEITCPSFLLVTLGKIFTLGELWEWG